MLDQFIHTIKSLEKNSINIIDRTIVEESSDLNREQLEEGKRADGSQITTNAGRSTYAPSYKKLKASRGLQNEYVDLKFSGKFHKSIKTEKKSKGVYENTSSSSLYQNKLKGIYGGNDQLLGLNEEKTEKLAQEIANDLETFIENSFK